MSSKDQKKDSKDPKKDNKDSKDPKLDLEEEEDTGSDQGSDGDNTAILIGVGVCITLLCCVGVIFWFRSRSNNTPYPNNPVYTNNIAYSNNPSFSDNSDCCTIPTHYTIEFKYADGVNPYNNFSIPPAIPKPPQYFG